MAGSDQEDARFVNSLGFRVRRHGYAAVIVEAHVEERGGQLGPIAVEFVRTSRPDYVMSLPACVEQSLLRSSWFFRVHAGPRGAVFDR